MLHSLILFRSITLLLFVGLCAQAANDQSFAQRANKVLIDCGNVLWRTTSMKKLDALGLTSKKEAMSIWLEKATSQIEKLFAEGNVDPQKKENIEQFHLACTFGSQEMVTSFLKAGFDKNQTNEAGQTPLMFATAHANVDVVDLLLKEGADVKAIDKHGTSAEQYKFWLLGNNLNMKSESLKRKKRMMEIRYAKDVSELEQERLFTTMSFTTISFT
jgi:hypothetical protein